MPLLPLLQMADTPAGTDDISATDIYAFIDSQIGVGNCAYPAALIHDICILIHDLSVLFGWRTSVMAAQQLDETNYFRFTGDVTPDQYNFAGMGTTGGGVKGESFTTPWLGEMAIMTHHMVYVYGVTSKWRTDLQKYVTYDPRYAAVLAAGKGGVIKTLADYGNGNWAASPVYATSILTIANKLITFSANRKAPMAGDDSRFQWDPEQAGEFGYPQGQRGRIQNDPSLPNFGKHYDIELAVQHITIGNDSLSTLVGAHQSSVTYLTDKLGKPRAQTLSENDAPWGGGHYEYNLRGIHLEDEKLSLTSPWSDEMYQNLAETWYPICKRRGIPFVYLGKDNGPGKKGFIGHSDIPDPDHPGMWGGSTHHQDPGANFDWNKFIRLLQALDTPSTPPVRTFPETGFSITAGFKGFWEELEQITFKGVPLAYLVLGYPVENEHSFTSNEHPGSLQRFERGWLIWNSQEPSPWDITLVQLGQATSLGLSL